MGMPLPADLPYGRDRISIPLPSGEFRRLTLPAPSPPPLSANAIKATLSNPIGSAGLETLAGSETEVVISVPDATRKAGADIYLPALVQLLGEYGVPDDHMTLMFALGLHRPLGEMEKMRVVGRELFERIQSVNHTPSGSDHLISLGETSRGTPVSVHRKAAEADLVITTSAITFHFHAGFSGGPKGIVPGLAGEETIRRNHLLSISGDRGWHEGCRPGRLGGNPVYEDLCEAVGLLQPSIYLANSLVDPQGSIFDFVSGDLAKAHALGSRRFRDRFGVAMDAPVDAAVVSAGGRPGDLNLIQAHKAVAHAAGVVRPGGTIVLVAECPEGSGHRDLDFWFGLGSQEAILEETQRTKKKYPQTAFALMDEAQRFDLLLVTAVEDDLVKAFGGRPVKPGDVAPFLTAKHGDGMSGVVIEQGKVLLPYVKGEGQ